jgi:hypothetical protein
MALPLVTISTSLARVATPAARPSCISSISAVSSRLPDALAWWRSRSAAVSSSSVIEQARRGRFVHMVRDATSLNPVIGAVALPGGGELRDPGPVRRRSSSRARAACGSARAPAQSQEGERRVLAHRAQSPRPVSSWLLLLRPGGAALSLPVLVRPLLLHSSIGAGIRGPRSQARFVWLARLRSLAR